MQNNQIVPRSVVDYGQVTYRTAGEMAPRSDAQRYAGQGQNQASRPRYVGTNDARMSEEHEMFLSKFLRFLGLLPLRSRPRSVIAFKTIYIDYHLQHPMRRMSPSLTIRTLSIHFKAINKTRLLEIVYLPRFNDFKPQLGETQGNSTVSAADLDLLDNRREDLERNRGGAWVSSVYDEMLAMLDHPSTIAFDESILHINQEDNLM